MNQANLHIPVRNQVPPPIIGHLIKDVTVLADGNKFGNARSYRGSTDIDPNCSSCTGTSCDTGTCSGCTGNCTSCDTGVCASE